MILGPNLGHPLNRKRLTWHLALPGRDGGQRTVDLMGRVPGVLVNLGTGWVGAQRPGSFGRAIQIPGISSYLDLGGVSAPLTGLSAASMAWWVYRTASTGTSMGQGQTNSRFLMQWHTDNKVYCEVENGGASFPNATVANTGWVRLLMAYDGSQTGLARLNLYVNGLAATLASGGSDPVTSITTPSTNNFRCGIEDSTAGTFDDVSVWTRTLTAADAWMDYSLSRAGYPGVLRRSSAAYLAAVSAVPGGGGGPAIAPISSYYRRRRRTG